MTTWYDLTAEEQVALVGIALSRSQQRKVIADDCQCAPYVSLCSLRLISIVTENPSCITYTIVREGINVLLCAPDDADGQSIFPTAADIREMKLNLQPTYASTA
jgi:hypothetical protein